MCDRGPPRALRLGMTMPRQVVPGRTYHMSRRCILGMFLLRPDAEVNALYEYLLAEAAERFEITLHAWTAMSNHQHILLRDDHGNYPAFLQHLDRMLSIKLGLHWNRADTTWAVQQASVVHCVEANDRFRTLLYVVTNPINENQVEHVQDWPGASSFSMMLSGKSRIVKRPERFFKDSSTMPAEVELRCERPDGFEDLSQDEWVQKIKDGVASAERAARAERQAKGTRVLGRKTVLRAKHTDTPKSVLTRGRMKPCIACRNPERRELEEEAIRVFRAKYSAMLEKLHAKAADILFPAGTYRLRLLGVPCAPLEDEAAAAPAAA